MSDLYLVALNKQKGREEESAALHYLLAKEATRCYPCGDVVVGAQRYEFELLAETVYYLAELFACGDYGIIRGAAYHLKDLYEKELAKKPEALKGYASYIKAGDMKLREYQKCVNEMDPKENPFARFDGYVKKHRRKQGKLRSKPFRATQGVEVDSLVEDSAL
jgi:hypothetical protein